MTLPRFLTIVSASPAYLTGLSDILSPAFSCPTAGNAASKSNIANPNVKCSAFMGEPPSVRGARFQRARKYGTLEACPTTAYPTVSSPKLPRSSQANAIESALEPPAAGLARPHQMGGIRKALRVQRLAQRMH